MENKKMVKVKLFNIINDIKDNYDEYGDYNSLRSIIVNGFSEWEEIDIKDYNTLSEWVRDYNSKSGSDSYLMVTPDVKPASFRIQERVEEVKAIEMKRKRENKKREEDAEKAKLAKLAKKAEREKKKLEELQKKYGVNI